MTTLNTIIEEENTPNTEKECCERCYGIHYTHPKSQWGDFPSCACHTPDTEWASVEEIVNNFTRPDEFVDREAYMDEHDYARFKEELRAVLIDRDRWWNTRLEFEKTEARLSAFREIYHSKEFQTLNKTLIKGGRNAGEPTEYTV